MIDYLCAPDLCKLLCYMQVFLRRFRDPIRVPRISENYHRVPNIREIGSPQVHTGYLKFSLKKNCYVLLYRTKVLTFNCGLSVAKYQHRLSAMKNKTSLLAQKSLIDRALPKTQSNMASSLAQLFRTDSGTCLSHCQKTQGKISTLSLLSVTAHLLHHNCCLLL